jgi:hypothetical protein
MAGLLPASSPKHQRNFATSPVGLLCLEPGPNGPSTQSQVEILLLTFCVLRSSSSLFPFGRVDLYCGVLISVLRIHALHRFEIFEVLHPVSTCDGLADFAFVAGHPIDISSSTFGCTQSFDPNGQASVMVEKAHQRLNRHLPHIPGIGQLDSANNLGRWVGSAANEN